MGEFTQALRDLRSGSMGTEAVNALFQVTYDDLKRLAHERLRRNQPVTALNTTSLVHESYLRFLAASHLDLEDRSHFMVYAARVMRSVIVDTVRRRSAQRRGGDEVHLTLGTAMENVIAKEDELLQMDEALTELGRVDPQLVEIVEMRYFAGLSVEEVAQHMGLSPRTVFRQWDKARLVLLDALREP
ncbi:MAG TPA: ECF-type sigma factor [Povalibacter sp.]|nr:ECF-type sigma factor [Povalibacter sp.]